MIGSETVRAYFEDKHAWMAEVLRGNFRDVLARRGADGLE